MLRDGRVLSVPLLNSRLEIATGVFVGMQIFVRAVSVSLLRFEMESSRGILLLNNRFGVATCFFSECRSVRAPWEIASELRDGVIMQLPGVQGPP